MNSLEHCPFCGCTDIQITVRTDHGTVCCDGCGANITKYGKTCFMDPDSAMEYYSPLLTEAWNRRAESGKRTTL